MATTGCVLRVIRGPGMGAELELVTGKVVVGSRPPADLVVRDAQVSGRHCSIEVTPEGLQVVDLGSTNGTFHLTNRITQAMLKPGAVLEIGDSQMFLAPRAG